MQWLVYKLISLFVQNIIGQFKNTICNSNVVNSTLVRMQALVFNSAI